MTRKKPYIYKRVIAYIIDLLIITILSGLLATVIVDNKEADNDTKRLLELVNKRTSSEITQEEFNNQYNDINYDITLHSNGITIITIGVTIIYYVVMSYFCHGITLGKYIMKTRIVSANDKKLNIFNYLLRSLIINSILINVISLILVNTLDKNTFISIYPKVSNVYTIVIIASFIFMMYRNDGRGLHDLISNTKIVNLKDVEDSNEVKEETKEIKKEIPDADIVSEKEKINKTNKKNSSKKKKVK